MAPRLKGLDPAGVFAAVAAMDDEEFDDVMAGSERTLVIESLIEHMRSQFRAERADGVEAVLHVKLWDRPEGGYDHYELVIAGGECSASPDPEREPQLTLKVRPSDLRRMVLGTASPMKLALRGRLRVLGDIRLGQRLPELFSFGS